MLKFKVIRWSTAKEAQVQQAKFEETGDIDYVLKFAASMVKEHDFVDEDGKSVDINDIDNLTLPQIHELMEQFSLEFGDKNQVPKQSA